MIKSYGVPDKHTPGNIGDIYQDLSTGNLYRCSAVITKPIEYQFMDIYAKSPKTEYDWNELLKEDTLKAFLDVRQCDQLFKDCRSLTTIPQLDTSNVTANNNTSNMFYNCVQMTNLSIKNIKTNLQVGSGTSYGYLLTVDSLLGLCKELITASSSKTLTIGSANLNKLANVYVKRITITDEMREEDPLIDQKIPFEVCDSTDEGAVLITNYTKSKKWTLR